jgi:hypothetical protein
MKLRKKKQTFETLNNRMHELRYSIATDKTELAEILALLEQYKIDVEVTTRSVKDEFGVSPMFSWQESLSV